MPAVEFSPGSVSRRRPAVFSGCDADHSVVWVRGAHDASTVVALCMTMARAIAFDDTDLVIDLSEVTFMDAATVAVMIRAEAFLRDRSRSLTLRSPSTHARRVLGAGGLAELVDPRPATCNQVMKTAGALASWVEVPTTEGADQRAQGLSPQPCRAANLAGRVTSPRDGASVDAHHTGRRTHHERDRPRRPGTVGISDRHRHRRASPLDSSRLGGAGNDRGRLRPGRQVRVDQPSLP